MLQSLETLVTSIVTLSLQLLYEMFLFLSTYSREKRAKTPTKQQKDYLTSQSPGEMQLN